MDWRQMLQDLGDAGMSQKAIAEALNIAQSEVSRLLNGQRRRVIYEVGARMIELHAQKIAPKPVEPAPEHAQRIQATRGPASPHWRRSDAGIEAKGRELGIPARPGETYRAYADRLEALIASGFRRFPDVPGSTLNSA